MYMYVSLYLYMCMYMPLSSCAWQSQECIPYVQDKSDADIERLKATVLLCYGYVCLHSPPK